MLAGEKVGGSTKFGILVGLNLAILRSYVSHTHSIKLLTRVRNGKGSGRGEVCSRKRYNWLRNVCIPGTSEVTTCSSSTVLCGVPYSAYVLQVINFVNYANLELFAKLIQLKFEPLQFELWATCIRKFFQRIPSKQLWRKFRPAKYKRYTVFAYPCCQYPCSCCNGLSLKLSSLPLLPSWVDSLCQPSFDLE